MADPPEVADHTTGVEGLRAAENRGRIVRGCRLERCHRARPAPLAAPEGAAAAEPRP
jgi:hypothetical protein